MKTVHFLDLRDRAVRTPTIERGMRYLECHARVGGEYPDDDPASAYAWEVIAGSGVHVLRNGDSLFSRHKPTGEDGGWSDNWLTKHPGFFSASTKPAPWWSSRRGLRFSWNFASDMGMWEVPGITYRNRHNFLLDIAALRREGIIVSTETVEV